MTSKEIRSVFLEFFRSKEHQVVPSAPMVVKNDPTLLFTNAGMNQFKDIFLGNAPAKYTRVADTQKCLRVSGKHNDLEEVGIDTYHHTMFEMLGNWSFGDYFKKEAIDWAFELLTEKYGIDKSRLYATVFEGDEKEKLAFDTDAYECWKKWLPEERILRGSKKDNFWEMGDTGPCGPCSEIHADLRPESDRKKTDGTTLVNTGHPLVVEIWNLVFIEFNRKADGSLGNLPARHVDTGMGFERLCMLLQGKTSNYDTDVFTPLINALSGLAAVKYGASPKSDIAIRVIADHIRAVSFAIADGQLPSNNKAGYVIRRILRRAVRYGHSFLHLKEPFLYLLVPPLSEQFTDVFPELKAQQEFIQKVIREEETSFLRTLSAGMERLEFWITQEGKTSASIPGDIAFELYDTYGFPVDLTGLIAREHSKTLDVKGFDEAMEKQKARSRKASAVDTADWVPVHGDGETIFTGYDVLENEVRIMKYRKVAAKNKEQYQLVFDKTPFYAESGGQVGDTGVIVSGREQVHITDTKKENNLIIHYADRLPSDPRAVFRATVTRERREMISANHSATHLLHAALRQVLGKHVAQKGSLVNEDHTRFDFSHFAKIGGEEINRIEEIVNSRVRQDILLAEQRDVPLKKAMETGAMALFGEKYGELVRIVTFDRNFSVELCGGTHVPSTGRIGMFKITSESAVSAGVRRIEAVTAGKAEAYITRELAILDRIRGLLKNPRDIEKGVEEIIRQNVLFSGHVDALVKEKVYALKAELLRKIKKTDGINLIAEMVYLPSAAAVKDLSFSIRNEVSDLFLILGAEIEGKAHLSLMISENLIKERNLEATRIIRELSAEIEGGGGGQPFYATAGGKKSSGLAIALSKAITFIKKS